MKKRIGVAADDVTGANDIGIMFAKKGYRASVFPLKLLKGHKLPEEAEGLDVIILDTDSRFDSKETAAAKVKEATALLMEISCDCYINKTCSVFRGNIGAELDAMQDALGISCSMVIAGFPKNGRTTRNGMHYVYGELLENSQFRNDPIHPMTTSSLAEIMSLQTSRSIRTITYHDLDSGYEACKKRLEQYKQEASYILFDIRSQEDLKLTARLIREEKNICGSSAIAEELPMVYDGEASQASELVFTVAGSLTEQSLRQIAYMEENGYPVLEFHTDCIYKENGITGEIEQLLTRIGSEMKKKNHVIVHSSNHPEQIKACKEEGKSHALTDQEIGKIISRSLSQITEKVMERMGCNKIIAAGGDTSASVTECLEIYRMDMIEEIEPGLPAMRGRSGQGEISLVLKSGSFGSEDFLEKAASALRRIP